MRVTVLYPEAMYPDDRVEREVFGPDVDIVRRDTNALAELSDADCQQADGLMVFRHFAPEAELARFPRLRAVVRMGVGYDRLDRAYAGTRGILICNVPDYGTTEVADHTMALALTLRRGLLLHHAAQRAHPPGEWNPIESQMIRRLETLRFGIVGLGRIGTAVALRARAFGQRVICYDPFQPNGVERALGIERVASLPELLVQADTLSLHVPLTRHTSGMIGAAQLAMLPKGAVLLNTARGPLMDFDAVLAALRSNHLGGAGLDVMPVEPPVEPLPELLKAYRAREPGLEGRLIITPHSAFHTPEAWDDIRRKSAETMRAALMSNHPQNLIAPEMD
jgi:C-terminal binding protein